MFNVSFKLVNNDTKSTEIINGCVLYIFSSVLFYRNKINENMIRNNQADLTVKHQSYNLMLKFLHCNLNLWMKHGVGMRLWGQMGTENCSTDLHVFALFGVDEFDSIFGTICMSHEMCSQIYLLIVWLWL